MKRLLGWALLLVLALPSSVLAVDRSDLDRLFDFSNEAALALPQGWGGGPAGTVDIDQAVHHTGGFSIRVRRDSSSEDSFSSASLLIPVDFTGETIVMRGWLKTEDVSGFAGLWLRQDGPGGVVGFDNMSQRGPRGTTDWQQFTIELPLAPDARQIACGFLVVGTGTGWADGLELLVDGQPIAEAPVREVPQTVLDTDREFVAGSGLDTIDLTPLRIQNLARLGRVWGFLKYHHPAVVDGRYHWDFELFRVLPAVLAAADRPAANQVLSEWIASLDEIPDCIECAQTYPDIQSVADTSWLAAADKLGADLSQTLLRIRRNRPVVDKQFFVSFNENVGHPDFSVEPAYREMSLPDAGYRLLALFRYWNIIEYWFPNRDVIGEDWPAVLAEFVPRVVAAATAEAYQTEILQLIAHVHDTHANLWSHLAVRPPLGDWSVPVAVQFIDDEAVVTGTFAVGEDPAPDLRPGDVIKAIDGDAVDELVTNWTPYYAASNQAARLRDVGAAMTGGGNQACDLLIDRQGREVALKVQRQTRLDVRRQYPRTHDRPGPAMQLLTPEVAYLKLSSVSQDSVPSYLAAAEGTRGWIIDIRNYPSEFMVFALGQHLVKTLSPFVTFTVGDMENPGTFTFSRSLRLAPKGPAYAGKIVILVDETTQSSAEYTTMAFRTAPDAVVIGSTTAGADGNVSTIMLPGGLRTMISGIGIFTPDRQPTQRVGIRPDIEVRPTRAGIEAGRDEVLEKAFAVIMGRDPDQAELAILGR